MKTRLLLLGAFIAFCAFSLFGADSGSVAFQIRDTATGKPANLKLHDNGDGTKSIVMLAVIVTPTPSSTATATATASSTATATVTATATPTAP